MKGKRTRRENPRIALLFPGQGAQFSGMARQMALAHPWVTELLAEADAALGVDPIEALCLEEGHDAELTQTTNTQPAVLATSIAFLRLLERRLGGALDEWGELVAAGHSLGEYSALVALGALDLATAVGLVRQRARYMQEAVPTGAGAMAAIIGGERSAVEDLIAHVRDTTPGVLDLAALNGPGQIVVAGDAPLVDRAVELAAERNVGRGVRLRVSAPFHCALMQPAAAPLAADLAKIPLAPTAGAVLSNVTARPHESAEAIRCRLVDQLTAPVLWWPSVEYLLDRGVSLFLEVGPGKVLSGLVRRILRHRRRSGQAESPPIVSVADPQGLDEALDAVRRLRAA